MNLPEGWKLVPVEPTEEMMKAADEQCFYCDSCKESTANPLMVWEAMLEAAPAEPICSTCNGSGIVSGTVSRGAYLEQEILPCIQCAPTPPAQEYSCPCGIGDKPCPDENGKPLCDDTPAQVVCKDPSAMCEEVGCKLDCGPAREDEPVAYEIYDATRKPCSWISVSKEKYLELTSIGWNGRTLYTRPTDDKLRKAAEEAYILLVDITQQFHLNSTCIRIKDRLRAALEGK